MHYNKVLLYTHQLLLNVYSRNLRDAFLKLEM